MTRAAYGVWNYWLGSRIRESVLPGVCRVQRTSWRDLRVESHPKGTTMEIVTVLGVLEDEHNFATIVTSFQIIVLGIAHLLPPLQIKTLNSLPILAFILRALL